MPGAIDYEPATAQAIVRDVPGIPPRRARPTRDSKRQRDEMEAPSENRAIRRGKRTAPARRLRSALLATPMGIGPQRLDGAPRRDTKREARVTAAIVADRPPVHTTQAPDIRAMQQ